MARWLVQSVSTSAKTRRMYPQLVPFRPFEFRPPMPRIRSGGAHRLRLESAVPRHNIAVSRDGLHQEGGRIGFAVWLNRLRQVSQCPARG